ncbi:Gfo/Idh/MocA family oxidoreductase [bacterium]|nr:Gfo/Idh/MocA family oxidoreductase [bacterium]
MSQNFAFMGVGGYIAPRHFEAINATGNKTVLAYDPNDSVGILDRYTQDVEFYTNFEVFSSRWEALADTEKKINWLSICSPNYLHASQMKYGLSKGAHVICEKPLVLDTRELHELKEYEQKYGTRVNTILQLRVHDALISLKNKVDAEKRNGKYQIELTYLTSRGPWYHESWKGNVKKSGGLATNIGVHFFDMLTWIFGRTESLDLHFKNESIVSGVMSLEKADVRWVLSVDRRFLPPEAVKAGKTTYRSITVDEQEIEFSEGFTDLHKKVYERSLAGNGFGLEDARTGIELVEKIRLAEPRGIQTTSHPVLRNL